MSNAIRTLQCREKLLAQLGVPSNRTVSQNSNRSGVEYRKFRSPFFFFSSVMQTQKMIFHLDFAMLENGITRQQHARRSIAHQFASFNHCQSRESHEIIIPNKEKKDITEQPRWRHNGTARSVPDTLSYIFYRSSKRRLHISGDTSRRLFILPILRLLIQSTRRDDNSEMRTTAAVQRLFADNAKSRE